MDQGVTMFEFEGKNIEVRMPNSEDQIEARLFSAGVFKRAATSKNPPPSRSTLMDFLINSGFWSEEKQNKIKELDNKITEGERQLARGGRTKDGQPFTKQQAKELAINMIRWRDDQLQLFIELRRFDNMTIEGIAEEASFDFLVARCSFADGKPIYSSYEDFIANKNTALALRCQEELSKLLYGSASVEDNPETQFLKKYKFVNDDLKFINENGELVDSAGRRVNEKGQYIDEYGNVVNENGDRIDDDGNLLEEFTEFPE